MLRSTALAVIIALLPVLLKAQDLTGTWQGMGGGNTFRLVLVKCGEKYVGHNYDTDGIFGYCKTNIEAVYNATSNKYKVTSKGFIAHTLPHSQTNFSLTWSVGSKGEQLKGSFFAKTALMKIMSLGIPMPLTLHKISGQTDTTTFMRAALEGCATKVSPAVPIVNAESADTIAAAPSGTTATEVQYLLQASTGRKNMVIKTIPTNARNITITVYDNGVQDGDSISIICDSIVIANRIAVNLQPVSFGVTLSERSASHEVILIAHNIGSIPPNTATIEVTAGTKKYTLTALSDLGSNAVIRFIYSDD